MTTIDLGAAAKIGVISDTHGLVRPELYDRLAGVDVILHAGDLGSDTIDVELSPIAPFYAVAGNVDGFGASDHPRWRRFRVGARHIGMTHVALRGGELVPSVAKWVEDNPVDLLVFGHTHEPLIETRKTLTLMNPGSCGPRRFSLPVTMGFIDVAGGALTPRLVDIVVT